MAVVASAICSTVVAPVADPTAAQGGAGAGRVAPSRPLGEIGTVDTIAGPGFCVDGATVVPESTTVRSLAVGADGGTYVDTGLLDEGRVGTVDPDGRVSLEPTAPAGTRASGTRDQATGSEPAAGRLAGDGAGGVLVAAGTSVVRLAATGALTTVAGEPASGGAPPGPPSSAGTDAGPVADARFVSVASIASGSDGRVFIAERLEPAGATVRIRLANFGSAPVVLYPGTPEELTVEVDEIATIAGGSTLRADGRAGDGAPALTATLAGTTPVMAAAGDLLYVSSVAAPPPVERPGGGFSTPADERPDVAVRVINLGGEAAQSHGVAVGAGAIETVAGGGPAGFGGDGGGALAASFGELTGIAADGDGNLFLADTAHHRIRRVDRAGTITTFAGTGGTGPEDGGFNGNDRLATSARLHRPFDVKVGPQGRVYISDRFNHQLRFVDDAGFIRSALGNGVGMTWSCTGGDEGDDRTNPGLSRGRPSGLAVGRDGSMYVANKALPQVKLLEGGHRVSTVAGFTGGGDPPSALRSPTSLAQGPDESLYVREDDLPRVLLANLGTRAVTAHGITVAPGEVETVAGDGVAGDRGDGGPALDARLAANGAVASDGQGTLFLAEQQSGRVRQVGPDGVITTLVGGEGASVASACCQAPSGVLVDPEGNLYVSDLVGNQVWFLNRGGSAVEAHGRTVGPGEIAVVAGTGQGGFAGEGGPALEAQLDYPAGLALDAPGNLYIANLAPRDDTIRRVDPGGTILTVAGSSTGTGFNGDGLKARLTAFSEMTGIATDACGNLLVTEEGGDRVRRVNLVGPCQASAGGPPPPPRDGRSLVLPLALAGAAGVAGLGLWLVRRRPG